jgi:OOP family OmpA-OmpF porin
VPALQAVPAGVAVNARQITVLPPFTWEAAKTEGVVAQKGGNTQAANVPDDFKAAKAALLSAVGLLEKGGVSLTGTNVSISGTVKTDEVKEKVLAALKTLPAGYTLAKTELEAPPPPKPFSFNVERADGTLTLSGGVPDDKAKTSILQTIKLFFSRDKVVDNLETIEGAPSNFLAGTEAGLKALSRMGSGSFSLDGAGKELKLQGSAFYEGAAAGIRESLGKLSSQGLSFDLAVNAAAPGTSLDRSTCQKDINDLMSAEKIHFETGKAIITDYSAGLLDQLVYTLLRCPESRVSIVGHTDSVGDPAANQELSEKRAEAVKNYLVGASIADSRLETSGKGASEPVADNGTDEGRALNRRIEFILQ